MYIKPCKASLFIVDPQTNLFTPGTDDYIEGAEEIVPAIMQLTTMFQQTSIHASMRSGSPNTTPQMIKEFSDRQIYIPNIYVKKVGTDWNGLLFKRMFTEPKRASVVFLAGANTGAFKTLAATLTLMGHYVVIVSDAVSPSIIDADFTTLPIIKVDDVSDFMKFILSFGRKSAESVLNAMRQVSVTL